MAILTAEYYKNQYEGVPIDDEKLLRLINRAERETDLLTNFRMSERYDKMSERHKTFVKNAISSQVEFLIERGETASSIGETSGSVTIGSFSKSNTAGASENVSQRGRYSKAVYDYLLPTGLLYKGVWLQWADRLTDSF